MTSVITHRPAPPNIRLFGSGPVVVHGYNVMDARDRTIFRARNGVSLRELAPVTELPTICSVNGEYVHPADWELVDAVDGDIVGFLTLPKGGGNNGGSLQAVIGIVLVVYGAWSGNSAVVLAGLGMLASSLLAPPTALPIAQIVGQSEAPSPTYSINLAGNSARLGQPLPVLYGRHILTPDFAAPPYSEYDDVGDQYYHALLCIGVMDQFTLESIMIDDTVLNHFVGFETQLIGPQYSGVLSLVNPAVVTAPEVASQEMIFGTYIGPFAACGPGLTASKIGIDILMPKGLFFAADDGTLDEKSVSFLSEARAITNTGAIAGSWFPLGIESFTLAQNSPVRKTYTYDVTPGRYEVRVQRLDVKDTNSRAAHDLQWNAMRAYLTVDTPLDSQANYLAIRIKANNQLSGLSQRRITVLIYRHLSAWNGSTWQTATQSKSIAWALADVLKNPAYGPAVPDSRIDLATLLELNTVWESRGDYFNAVFDKRITVWNALTMIARCGRARPIMRGNVFTFIRDQAQELPTAVFTMRNIVKNSFQLNYSFVTENSPDGLELEFFNQDTWQSDFVQFPVPGVEDPANVAKASVIGITHTAQAQRECIYMASESTYRAASLTFKTEMDGLLPAFGDLIGVAHDIAGWGQSGEIESWDDPVAISTEDLTWSVGNNYAILIDEYGDPQGPYLVTAGPELRSIQFLEPPSFDPYTGTERERTRFCVGPASAYVKFCRVTSLVPDNANQVTITAVVEDSRVHTVDEPYPGRGSNASGDSGSGGSGGTRIARYAPAGIPNYNAASDAQRNLYGFYSDPDRTVGTADDPGYVYTT